MIIPRRAPVSFRIAVTLLVVLALAAPASGQGYTHIVVAKTGDVAPGTGGLTFGATFTAPALNSVSDQYAAAFLAQLTGPGVTANVNDRGIFSRTTSGSLEYVARTGDPITTGAGTATLATINPSFPAVGLDGRIGFTGTLSGGGITTANDGAAWVGTPGNLTVVAREGDAVPFGGGATFTQVTAAPLMLAEGSVVIAAQTSDGRSGLFTGSPGNVSAFAQSNTTAPDTGGATFSGVSFETASTNGTIGFRGNLVVGGTVTSANSVGIWAGTTPGTTRLIIRADQIAPTIGTAVVSLGGLAVLGNGQVVVPATAATGGAVTTANDTGLFVGTTQANLQLVVREGMTIPNSGGAVLGPVTSPFAGGNTAGFRTVVAGAPTTSDSALFTWNQTAGLVMLAREGNTAPGTGGAVFGQLGTGSPTFAFGQIFTLNRDGRAAFYAPLTGTGTDATNNTGIWAQTDGGLVLVVRKGQQIDLDPGPGTDLATIASLGLYDNGPPTGFGQGMNAGYGSFGAGFEVAWAATFTDGRTAAFVSVIPVPEPLGVLAVAGAGGWLATRRRRVCDASLTEGNSISFSRPTPRPSATRSAPPRRR
jgi:hypothetical protein